MLRTPLFALALATSLAAASCASRETQTERLDRIRDLVRAGRYEEAARASVTYMRRVDPESEAGRRGRELQRDISIASGLEAARAFSVEGQDVRALEILRELDAAHPGNQAIVSWRRRTEGKLADRWFNTAREAVAAGDFDAARAAYRRTVDYDPSRTVVQELLAEMDIIEEYRADVAEELYFRGVRQLTDEQVAEARSSFGAVNKYAEGDPRAKRRLAETERVIAQQHVAAAEQLAKDGRYAAAAMEYTAASRLDPENEVIARNAAAFEVERKAQAALTQARGMMLRKDFDGAEALLRETMQTTALQTEAFETQLVELADQRTEVAYTRAVALAQDFQFEEARGLFAKILEERDFFKDTRARLDAVDGTIALAARLYAEAAEQKDPAEKLSKLQQVELIWPDYRDIAEQIIALRARLKTTPSGTRTGSN